MNKGFRLVVGTMAVVSMLAMTLSGCRGGKGTLDSDVHSIPVDNIQLSKLKKLIVSVPVNDLPFRLAFEEQLVTYLTRGKMKPLQFTKVFPPIKEYSDQEISKRLADLDLQAILVVTLDSDKQGQAGTATSGKSVSPTSAWGYPSGSGFFVQGVGVTESDSTTKILSNREVRAKAIIYALPTQQQIWIAGLVTKAEDGPKKRGLTSDRYISKSAADEISNALTRDGYPRK